MTKKNASKTSNKDLENREKLKQANDELASLADTIRKAIKRAEQVASKNKLEFMFHWQGTVIHYRLDEKRWSGLRNN